MKDTPKAAPEFQVPAINKTWDATMTYRECGVVTAIVTYTVTLDKTSGELIATVDGEQVDVLRAARILSSAKDDNGLRLTREVRPVPPSMLACLGVSA